MTTLADLLLSGGPFGPALPTPRTRAGLPEGEMRGASLPTPMERALDIAEMPARGVVGQAQRAGQSVSDAYADPTLANITDAAVQSGLALAPVSPQAGLVAAGAGGLGVLEALRRDYAPSLMGGAADAKPKLKGTIQEDTPASPPEDDPLDPSQRQRLTALQRKQAKGETLSRAEREEQNTYLQTLAAAATAKAQARTTATAQQEASRRKTAETAYDTEKARDLRFQDTETGKLFAKLGPVAPGVVAAGVGAAAQLPRTLGWAPQGAMNVATHPITKGTMAGVAAANWPQVYDAAYAPAMNPSYAAMQAYVAEAPPGDERAARYRKLLEDNVVPKENTVREVASKDLYDPVKLAERSGLGAIEGVTGGPLGAALVKSFPGLVRSPAAVPGLLREGYQSGMEGAALAEAKRQAAEGKAAIKRSAAQEVRAVSDEAGSVGAEARVVSDEAARRSGGRTGGAGPAETVIGDPPQPPSRRQLQPATGTNRQTSKSPPEDAGTVKAIAGPRKTVSKEDTDQILRNLVSGKPPGDGLAGYSPQAIQERADYLQKLAGSLGTPLDKMLEAGKLKKGPWSIAVGGAVGTGAALEDDTSPTGYRDESGRFAKGKSLDDAVDKAMGGAP